MPANPIKTRDVRAVSIDQFCAEYRLKPQVIKIDVEGAEFAVLRGARSTIAGAGPGLQLFVEMHPHLWPGLGISVDDVRGECEAQGLVAEAVDGRGEDIWQTEGVCLRLRPTTRMRIVIAHESVETEGGAETYLVSVIQGLRERGHQIALLYHRRSDGEEGREPSSQ